MGKFFPRSGDYIDFFCSAASLINGQRKGSLINAVGSRVVYRVMKVNGICLHLLQKEILRKGAKPRILMGFTIQMQCEDACKSKESKKEAPLFQGKGSFQEDTRKNSFVVLYAEERKRMTGALTLSELPLENDSVASALFAEIEFFVGFL